MIRLSKNSRMIFDTCKNEGNFEITRMSDGIADVWYCIKASVPLWHHFLCDASGPVSFNTVDDALGFLKRRKVYADKIIFPS